MTPREGPARMAPATETEPPIRQAARFFRSLESSAAEAMLARLSPDEASALRAAIAGLGEPEPALPAALDRGGVELCLGGETPPDPTPAAEAKPSATPIKSPAAAAANESDAAPIDGAEWLRSLREADPQAIADYLSREQPRAIAVVLGYLAPDLSAGVLRSLPAVERGRVVAQLASAGDADPDSLRVIAGGLAAWVNGRNAERRRRSDRLEAIRKILAATPESERGDLLADLAQSDPQAVAELRPNQPPTAADSEAEPTPATTPDRQPHQAEPPAWVARTPAPPATVIPFNQLHRLDSRALAEAASLLDGRSALLALAGASDALFARLTGGMSRKAAAELRRRVHRVGPTTLAEIDRAQAALAEAAARVVARRRSQRANSKVEA